MRLYLLAADLNPYAYLKDTSPSSDPELRRFASTATGVVLKIGFSGVILTSMAYLIVAMIGRKNPQKRNEIKEIIGYKLTVAFLLSCFTVICSGAKYIAEQMI